jgi:hypothetical protein
VGTLRSKILAGVLVATVRGAVGSLAILLSDSRYQNVGGLKWTTPIVSPISSVAGGGEAAMSTA